MQSYLFQVWIKLRIFFYKIDTRLSTIGRYSTTIQSTRQSRVVDYSITNV